MIFYRVYEGTENSDDLMTEFRNKKEALHYAKKSESSHVQVDKWKGDEIGKGVFDGDYLGTIYEKKGE